MAEDKQPEFWLRGPVQGIIEELQPVAHAILQAREEIKDIMAGFPKSLLWEMPAGTASPGFHLQHIAGVQDRLLTYTHAQALSTQQLEFLKNEGKEKECEPTFLVEQLWAQTEIFLNALKEFSADELKEWRGVGRAQLPSTVLGLLMHAAEHTMRHTGQLLVTVKVLSATVSSLQ